MPDMDGLELFERLRAQNDKLPIIVITGNALSQECNLYLEMGFNHVLTKRLIYPSCFNPIGIITTFLPIQLSNIIYSQYC